jgi:hypothetical protein
MPVVIYQTIPNIRQNRIYCYDSHQDSSNKRSFFSICSFSKKKINPNQMPTILFKRCNSILNFKFENSWPIIGVINDLDVNEDSTEMMVINNNKRSYRSLEKHRDHEFTIHESEAGKNGNRKNEKRMRFIFSEDFENLKIEFWSEKNCDPKTPISYLFKLKQE